jgi:hypothetical protein
MRVLLAALNAPKGEVAGNLERHLAVLERARAEGCELAVFPEFSLTGSVDPASHPERAPCRSTRSWCGRWRPAGERRWCCSVRRRGCMGGAPTSGAGAPGMPGGWARGSATRSGTHGEVTRLPDWRPGILTVEVPVDAGASGRVAPRR